MSETYYDDLKTNGHIKGTAQEIGLIIKFSPSEVQDLIACASERGFDQLGDMAREILLEAIAK